MSEATDPLAAAIAALVAATRTPDPAPAAPRPLLTVDETAERLRVSRAMIYQSLKDGRIKSVRIGRRRLIPATEVERLINEAA